MSKKQRFLLFASCVGIAVGLGSLAAAEPAAPEYGLRGLRRVELAFINNVGTVGIAGGVVPANGDLAPTPANADLETRELAKDQECMAIGPTLLREGLDVVERCRADDFACAKLYLTVGDQSGTGLDRIYLNGIAVSQRVRLVRDPKLELSMPTTWSMHRVAVVGSDHSATRTSCIALHDMASWFAASWKEGNR